MGYMDILKRSWHITWDNKILWLFGLFAIGGATGGGSGGSGSGYNFNAGEIYDSGVSDLPVLVSDPTIWFLVALATVALILILAGVIVGIVSYGGLIHLSSEADEGRAVSARAGWCKGLAGFFRVFGIWFLVGLIALVPIAVIITMIVMIIIPMFQIDPGGMVVGIVGVCGLGLVLIVVAIVASVLSSMFIELATRHALLRGLGVFDALSAAWTDIRRRYKDVLFILLILWGISIVFSIAAGIMTAVVAVPAVFAFFAKQWVMGGILMMAAVLLSWLVSAPYKAYTSTVWTVFFHRLRSDQHVL